MSGDDDLEAEFRRLRSQVEALQHRVTTLEETLEDTERPDVDEPTVADDRDATVDPSDSEGDDAPTGVGAQRGRDWERDLGIRWLGLVGAVALVVGVVLFVRLAIEIGLLGPLGRVIVGTVGGLALLVGGRFAAERQGYVRWGRIAAGAGLAVAYFSCYAAYGFESYREAIGTPLWIVLLALTALVAGTAAASVRDGAPVVTGEAFLLGYATAYLAASAAFVLTPAYALVLAGGLVVVATIRPWGRLLASSVPLTYGLLALWIGDVDPEPALVAAVVTLAFAIYLAGGYVLGASGRDDRWLSLEAAAVTTVNGLVAAGFLEITARSWFPDAPVEGVAVAGVALVLVGAYAGTDRQAVRRDDVAGALAVVLFGGSVALATGTFATTVGLLGVLCGAIAVAHLADAGAFRTGAHLVAAGTVYKLLVVDAVELPAFDAAEPLATATGRAVAFALAIAVFYGVAWWLREATATLPASDEAVPVAAPYAWAGTGLTVVVLFLELSGLGVSVAWAAFGFVLVGVGLTTDVRGLRLQGVAVLGLATGKVFLYDTRDLDTVARTLSFLVLGAVLLAASYAYARWQGEEPLARLTE